MIDEDIRKLGESMGWAVEQQSGGRVWKLPNGTIESIYWDPYTDANADYQILEWVRKQPHDFICAFRKRLKLHSTWDAYAIDYQIGQFASAALRVITRG